MNLCMECKHFIPSPQEQFCRCAAILTRSPISGKEDNAYCCVERGLNTAITICGPDGKLFEPRRDAA